MSMYSGTGNSEQCRSEQCRAGRRIALFHRQQSLLAVQTAAVAGQPTAGADDPVARNDDADRIASIGQPHRPRCSRRADLLGDLPVGAGLAVRNRLQSRPDPALELRTAEFEVKCEFGQLPGEVRLELLDGVSEGAGGGGLPSRPVRFVGLIGHPQVVHRRVGSGQGERTDRAVDCSVPQ